jgi:hypothetical protein
MSDINCYHFKVSCDTGPYDDHYSEFFEIINPKGDVIGQMKLEDDAIRTCIALNAMAESGFNFTIIDKNS